jgi:hypothetical protein
VDEVTGILVAHDATDLATAMSRILGNPTFAAELGLRSRAQTVARFSLGAAAARLDNYLEKAALNAHDVAETSKHPILSPPVMRPVDGSNDWPDSTVD